MDRLSELARQPFQLILVVEPSSVGLRAQVIARLDRLGELSRQSIQLVLVVEPSSVGLHAQVIARLDRLSELTRQFVQLILQRVQFRSAIRQSDFQTSNLACRIGRCRRRGVFGALSRQLGLQFGQIRLPTRQRRFQSSNPVDLPNHDRWHNNGSVLSFNGDD